MIVEKFLILLCFVSGIVCRHGSSTTSETVSEGGLLMPNDEDSSDEIIHTDVDTRGDIIITSEPELETVEDATNDTIVNGTEEIPDTTEIVLPSTTENVTLPDEIYVSPCSSNPCKNGGMCEEDPFSHVLYTCDCADGYTGTHCQVADRCAVDDKGNVCSKGACVYDKEGLARSCECFFGMFWNEIEKECRDSQPPCLPNPCHNGGTCLGGEGEAFRCACRIAYEGDTCGIPNWCVRGDVCDNGECKLDPEKGVKLCQCNSGFYWNEHIWECDEIEPPCLPNPCRNNGICELVANGTTDFNCTCTHGFTGLTCEIKDMCTPSADGQGVCANGMCETLKDSRRCVCNSGFYLDEAIQTCKEILRPCFPNPCSHDGICVPLSQEHYNCTCSDGYVGNQCTDLDYCALNGGNGFCGEAECWNDPQLKIFFCSCENKQYFDYTTRTCVDVDFCPLMKCGENEVCEKSICKCDEDFERNNSTGKCEPQLCSFDSCPVKDLNCFQDAGSVEYRCSCEKGHTFNGSHCNGGADCVFPSMNSCKQICKMNENEAVCSCAEDFFEMSDDNKTCSPLFGNVTCEKKSCYRGICVVTPDSEMCICSPGYTEVEGNCVDLCSAGRLPEGFCPNNLCESTSTGFRCKCEGKFTLSDDQTTCTVRQVCRNNEIGWSSCNAHNAECVEDWNTNEGYRCQCLDGQTKTTNGDCQDVCSDAENQKMCSIFGAECDSSSGGVTCKCPPYFQPFQNGTVCNKPATTSYLLTLPLNSDVYRKVKLINGRRMLETAYEVDFDRIQKDITSTLNTVFPGLLQTRVIVCRENKNYILCKTEMQFSSVSMEDLRRLKLSDNCLTVKDSIAKCLLPPSMVLQRMFVDDIVAYKKTDPCDVDIKEGICGSDTLCTSSLPNHSFNCTCKDGFAARLKQFPFGDTESYIESCRDIDECLDRNACPQHMYCKNTIGSYMCSCKPRYLLKDTANPNSGCLEICNPNPCLHGICSSVGDHDFECRCDPGYSGILCNLRDENFKRAWTNTVVVGAVLGGALLVTLILSIVYTSRLKKRKYSDGPERMLYATEMTERRNVDSGTINNAFQK